MHDGGFVVRTISLSKRAINQKIGHVASSLYRQAYDTYGHYVGPWPLKRTPDGSLFIQRMISSNPNIFNFYTELGIDTLVTVVDK